MYPYSFFDFKAEFSFTTLNLTVIFIKRCAMKIVNQNIIIKKNLISLEKRLGRLKEFYRWYAGIQKVGENRK